jgi:ankyrin repeat protein
VNALADNGDTPLHVAMRLSDENQCLIITKLLDEAGCSLCEPDADDKPPIHAAVVRGFVSVVEYLLSQDVPLPSRILFAALQSIVVKRVEMIRLLVSKGASIHVLNPNGDALLHFTMRSLDRSVCLEIASILIDVGCNPLALNLRGETPLHIAVQQGYHEIFNYLASFSSSSGILSLLQDDPAVQVPMLRSLIDNADGSRFSPEEDAAMMQFVRELLEDPSNRREWATIFVGAAGDVSARSSGNEVLLDIALKRGLHKIVDLLLPPDLPLPPATLDLFIALRCQPSNIPFLIRRGADVHALDEHGDTLLHVATWILGETQWLTTTQVLVEAGCNPFTPNVANKQPIHIAVSRGFESVVKYLLSYTFNAEASLPPDLLFTALQYHAKHSMIRLLVDHGAAASHLVPNGNRLLHKDLKPIVDENEYLRTMKFLCEAGCNSFPPDACGNTPLHFAVTRGFTSVVAYLLSRDLPLPSDILFALRQSSRFRRYRPRGDHKWISMISSLVRKGADVHAQDRNRNTLLHHVLSMGALLDSDCLEVIKIFTEAGCSASIRNVDGKLPIQIAVTRKLLSVVEYLLLRNAAFPPDILFTVLGDQSTSSDEVLRMVSLFVEHGADVCIIAANGDTVLHVALAWAARRRAWWGADYVNQLLDIVDALVRAGCNPHACDARGRTPLELAVARGHPNIADYLRRIPPVPAILTSSSPTE